VCLLAVIEPGADTPADYWRNAADANPDGFGFAVNLGTDVLRFRSMDYRTTRTAWEHARERWPNAWALWHWRWATGGGVRRDMAHPFRWGDDARLVVAHNGVLPIPATATASDTALFADRLRDVDPVALDNPAFMRELGAWATGSKLAILSVHPDTADAVYIVNEDAGHWLNGVWYSNRSYREPEPWPPRRPWVPTLWARSMVTEPDPTPTGWESCDAMDCGVCGATYLVPVDDPAGVVCPDCAACWCCDEPADLCECWGVGGWDGAAYN
jgi:glutamine amidotransferase